MVSWNAPEHYTMEDLYRVCRILRDPVNGCPWDKVQTHASIRKNFLEETCEVLEAIDAEDPALLQEELGDVLMQVALHTCMEDEQGRFTLEDVCRTVCEKLVRRHPHIFPGGEDGITGWEALKNKEKGRRTLADQVSTVPATLPALMRVQKLQKRAAEYRPMLDDAALAEQRLDEAYACLKARLHEGAAPQEPGVPVQPPAAQREAGEFLLAAANLLRLAGVDAEEALSLAGRGMAAKLCSENEQ